MDNVDAWVNVGWGLVVYVSFARGTTDATVCTAARKVLHAPVLTRGVWGDGGRPQSVAHFCQEAAQEPGSQESASSKSGRTSACPDVLVIPQAALTNKYAGKSIQYRNQSSKDEGRRLFELFVAELGNAAHVHPDHAASHKSKAQQNMGKFHARQAAKDRDLALDISDYFRESEEFRGKFSEFDDAGFPTLLADGAALSKNARKKLVKAAKAHEKRRKAHLEALAKEAEKANNNNSNADGGSDPASAEKPAAVDATTTTATTTASSQEHNGTDDAVLTQEQHDLQPEGGNIAVALPVPRVVSGTFGNRQALKLRSDMGPFSHVFVF